MAVRKRSWITRGKLNKETGEREPGELREAWVVDYVDRQGDRHIKTFDQKKKATAHHAEFSEEVNRGVHVAASKSVTLEKAGEIWIEASKLEGLERGTLLQYEGHLKHILPVLGRVKLSDLTSADVANFINRLRRGGMSLAMTKKVLVSLGSLISEAQRHGLVARNVARDGARRKKRNAEARGNGKLKIGVDIPAPEEVTAIVAHAKGRWRPLLIVAAFTGLRASELRGLTWANVDDKKNELHVRQRADRFNAIGSPKSHAGDRTVPFGPTVANTLKEWRLACPKGALGLVFPNNSGKIENLSNIIQRGLIPTVIAAGLTDNQGNAKYTGMHVFRHFFASWLIDRKLDAKVIQERLGHSSITMTYDRYGHLFPRRDDAAEIADAELKLIGA